MSILHLKQRVSSCFCFVCILLLAAMGACTRSESGSDRVAVVSLLDEVSDRHYAGPWRPILVERAAKSATAGVVGLSEKDGVLLQIARVSVLTFGVSVHAGERVLVVVSYDERWSDELGRANPPAFAEVQILSGDTVIASSRAVLRGWNVEFILDAAKLPAERLEIRHLLMSGTPIPLNSIVSLSLLPEATPHDIDRARSLAGWTARDHSIQSEVGLQHKKFPVRLELYARDALALTHNDTTAFSVIEPGRYDRLRFSIGGLRVIEPEEAMLRVDAEYRSGWVPLASFTKEDVIRPSSWNEITIPVERDPRSLRFSFTGKGHVIALAEPVLIPSPQLEPTQFNLLLIDLDTMRADRLGCYGYTTRPTSVRLDSLLNAYGFRVFTQAYSSAPWTLPATAKFLTSRFVNIEQGRVIPREYTTLPEILRANGYFCIAFTGGAVMRFPGFEQGFHEYYYSTDRIGKIEDTFPQAIDWLVEQQIRPFFLFLHTYETHTPYTRSTYCDGLSRGRLGDVSLGEPLFPADWTRTEKVTRAESLYIQATYDSSLRKACDATRDILVELEQLDLIDKTIVVILSDHGEEFWDHSNVFSDHPHESLYNELLRVPFMVYSPDCRGTGPVFIDDEVCTVDLLPTVAEMLNIPVPDNVDGISLKPLMEGAGIARKCPIIGTTWPEHRGDIHISPDECRVFIVSDGMKYIEHLDARSDMIRTHKPLRSFPVNEELYDLDEDPYETRNYSPELSEISARMRELLRIALSRAARPFPETHLDTLITPMPGDLVKQLQALGYISEE